VAQANRIRREFQLDEKNGGGLSWAFQFTRRTRDFGIILQFLI
jgi:hypothetical protein